MSRRPHHLKCKIEHICSAGASAHVRFWGLRCCRTPVASPAAFRHRCRMLFRDTGFGRHLHHSQNAIGQSLCLQGPRFLHTAPKGVDQAEKQKKSKEKMCPCIHATTSKGERVYHFQPWQLWPKATPFWGTISSVFRGAAYEAGGRILRNRLTELTSSDPWPWHVHTGLLHCKGVFPQWYFHLLDACVVYVVSQACFWVLSRMCLHSLVGIGLRTFVLNMLRPQDVHPNLPSAWSERWLLGWTQTQQGLFIWLLGTSVEAHQDYLNKLEKRMEKTEERRHAARWPFSSLWLLHSKLLPGSQLTFPMPVQPKLCNYLFRALGMAQLQDLPGASRLETRLRERTAIP